MQPGWDDPGEAYQQRHLERLREGVVTLKVTGGAWIAAHVVGMVLVGEYLDPAGPLGLDSRHALTAVGLLGVLAVSVSFAMAIITFVYRSNLPTKWIIAGCIPWCVTVAEMLMIVPLAGLFI